MTKSFRADNTNPSMGGHSMFAIWGRLVYRFRWIVLVASLLMLPASVMLMRAGGNFNDGATGNYTQSERGLTLIQKQLGSTPTGFTVIFSSSRLHATDPRFERAVEQALASLRLDSHVSAIHTAYERVGGRVVYPTFISRDGHRSLVAVELRGAYHHLMMLYPDLQKEVHSTTLRTQFAGNLPLNEALNTATFKDLHRGEEFTLPVVLLLLLLVFGSVVAAGLPLGVGILAMAGGFAATLLLARFTDVSSYSMNIITMIGLGVAIDYSLFVVSRFREEITRHPVGEALAQTMATAGRAIVFSGTTVGIGLIGMMFYHFGTFGTVGLAGTLSVVLAVVYTLTFLAALLAILGHRVNRARIPFIRPDRVKTGHGAWHRLAQAVMRRPWHVLIPTVILLVALGLPILHLRLANSDYTALPKTSPARQAQELLTKEFPGGKVDEILVVLKYAQGNPLNTKHVGEMVTLSRWLGHLPHVTRVDSPVDINPGFSRAAYEHLYSQPRANLSPETQAMLKQSVGKQIAVLTAYTPARASSDEARNIVKAIRAHHPPVDAEVLVTGDAAHDNDGIQVLIDDTPLALGFMMVATYIVLFLLLGSVLLPLKAIIMNLLSISASYGALVWVFQDGHLSGLLGFTPNPIDIVLPVILFCIMFGLSMDYEVMLLSRFKEHYERTGDNAEAVALGLEQTGRLVTGAAAIMATVFFGFGIFSETTIIKAFGLGMGIAVVVDAAIVRTLLVPATMRLLGDWNWWAPAPLARLYKRLDLAERSGDIVEEEATAATAA
ncbi:MAG TPA: MMPL family transporter [Chloroflexota bacterium]